MIKIRVPATSANIGAGFDCMGLSLNLYNEIIVSESDKLSFEIFGEGENEIEKNENNLVYQSMKAVFDLVGKSKNVHIVERNYIPVASGLGSSAACVVGGVLAANAILGFPLSESEIVNLCAKLDGHPDNVVPAVVGGITAGVLTEGGKVVYIKSVAPAKLDLVVATPDFPLKTSLSRSVLPASYSRSDVVYSLSRAVVTFAALSLGDNEALRIVGDKLHEPYRRPLIKGYDEVVAQMWKNDCLSVYISGAGPSIVGLFSKKHNCVLPPNWTLRNLAIDNQGAKISIE